MDIPEQARQACALLRAATNHLNLGQLEEARSRAAVAAAVIGQVVNEIDRRLRDGRECVTADEGRGAQPPACP